MGVVFIVSGYMCYLTTLYQGKMSNPGTAYYTDQDKAIDLNGINFKTSRGFNYSTIIIIGMLAIIYGYLW